MACRLIGRSGADLLGLGQNRQADVRAMTAQGKGDEWMTPDYIFDGLHDIHKFDLDPAAPRGYERPLKFFTIMDDGLSKGWEGVIFCNPPWSNIGRWLAHGYHQMKGGHAKKIVWLLPSRTGTAWWHEFYKFGEIQWFRKRIKFKGAKHNCPEWNCLWIWTVPMTHPGKGE